MMKYHRNALLSLNFCFALLLSFLVVVGGVGVAVVRSAPLGLSGRGAVSTFFELLRTW